MTKAANVSELVRDFVNRETASYQSVPFEDAERRMAVFNDSQVFLFNQTRRWPAEFNTTDAAYKESVRRLFDSNRTLMKDKGQDIPPDFVERYFNTLKVTVERDESNWDLTEGFGHGIEAALIALVATSVLFSLNETANAAGADNRAVLEGAVSYLEKGNMLWLLEHALKLMNASAAELPSILRESR